MTAAWRSYLRAGGFVRLAGKAIRVFANEGPAEALRRIEAFFARVPGERAYRRWVDLQDTVREPERQRIRAALAGLARRPLVSIVLPTYNSPEHFLRAALDSVRAQLYPDWELCIADDASTDARVREVLDGYAAQDPRIKVTYRGQNGHISAATNTALAAASGEFVCLMDHDDLIPEHALFELVAGLNQRPLLDMIYSDQDKLAPRGERCQPFFKPDWSPDYLESCNYTAHLALYRKSIVDRIGGFRSAYNGAQDYDFVLRFTEQTDRIGHVPKVLYHWRAIAGSTAASMDNKAYVVAAGAAALEDRLKRTGRTGRATQSEYPACFDVRVELPRRPLVSLVIPTAGRERSVRGRKVNLLANCVRSVRDSSTYANYELVLVDNGDLPAGLKQELARQGGKFVSFADREFNISRKINLGAAAASGEYLLLLNDDIEVIAPDWIEAMLEQALKPGVGAVGAKLLYEDGTLQHAGVVHCKGLPDHVRKHFARRDPGYFFSTISAKNYLAVTGACMLTPADLFRKVGGFDESFKVNYSDIDYCMKLRQLGCRAVYTPHAELYHYESASRLAEVAREEIDLYLQRWGAQTAADPYYNGDYLQTSPPDFSLGGRIADASAVRHGQLPASA